jgi:hypothetical protein
MRRHEFQVLCFWAPSVGVRPVLVSKAVLNNVPDIRAREFRSLRPPFGAAFLSWGSTLRPA